MSQAPSVAFAVDHVDLAVAPAVVSLKGTARGLEIQIASAVSAAALAERLTELLAEAPSFFAGSDAHVIFDAPLPTGALACLEDVAVKFELKLIGVAPATKPMRSYAAVVRRVDQARRSRLAEGTGPTEATAIAARAQTEPAEIVIEADEAPALAAEARAIAAAPEALEADAAPEAISEGTPVEVALANTAPYSIVEIQEEARLAAAAVEAELASAVSIDSKPFVSPRLACGSPSAATLKTARASLIEVMTAHAEAVPAQHAAAIEEAVAHAVEALDDHVTEDEIDARIERRAAELATERVAQRIAELEAKAAEVEAAFAQKASEAEAALAQKTIEAEASFAQRATELEAASLQKATELAETLAAQRAPELANALAPELATVLARELVAAELAKQPVGPRFVIGPVRSGVIVDHAGHVIIIGDVNPGAEVRAEGSIIILGRLRGVAHAAIGREAGCIVALSLQPQQLRIGRMVARAGAGDRPSDGAEIAYATGETIVVERFTGRLPSGLAASM